MKLRLKKSALWLLVLPMTFFLASFDGPAERMFDISKNLDIFATLYKELNKSYVDDVDPNALITKGISSMLKDLDPYTSYIPEDKIEDYRRSIEGNIYGGIGAVISKHDDRFLIIMPKEGFPAHEKGLQVGDQLLKIDNQTLEGKTVSDVSKMLRGQQGTDVTVLIKRQGTKDPFTVTINRQNINSNNVTYYGLVNQETGLIKLEDFTRNAANEVSQALTALKAKGAKQIIFDLRGNPGGLLNEAIDIANIFIPRGKEVVSTRGKIQEWNRVHQAANAPVDVEIPIVVLTDGMSASASEIVSGVIQDYDRGVLVGRNTFGKGLVQATKNLSYNAKLKVTVAKYYIPSGRCIQKIDYSHKDENGKATAFPDSLKREFKTVNSGRKVYDGAGVAPDIVVEIEKMHPIVGALERNHLFFDYAMHYRQKNPTIPDAKTFEISDKDYEDFITWLKDKKYEYTTALDKQLQALYDTAKDDEQFAKIEPSIIELKKIIEKAKQNDLKVYKKQLITVLKTEIASHYYLERGALEASFSFDPDILQALEVLNNSSKYKKILGKP